MKRAEEFKVATAFLLIVGLLAVGCLAGATPKVTSMRTCSDVVEWPSKFEASGWTMDFAVGQTVYCVVSVEVPGDAPRASYDGTMRWYTPSGKLYYEHDYDDLERGYIWSLWGSIAEANIAGEWRVTFSLRLAASQSIVFTVGSPTQGNPLLELPGANPPVPSLDLPGIPPVTEAPSSDTVAGREEEPNEKRSTANRLSIDDLVQGEASYHTGSIYDQDWFEVDLPLATTYWLEISAIAETPDWLDTKDFLTLYTGNAEEIVRFSSYSEQERDEEQSTCDVVIPLRGPGRYYALLSTRDLGHNLIYSLQIATTVPQWAEDRI